MKSLRICFCHCVNLIEILLYDTSPIPPRKLKVSWCNDSRASFEYAAINNHPSQPTGTYSIFLSADMLAQIKNNFKRHTCTYLYYYYYGIFFIPICLLNFYIEQKPVIIFMNSYECTKTYSRYFFLYKPNEENRKHSRTSKTMFRNVLLNSYIKISYLLLQLHIQRYMLFTTYFECFYIYIPNSKKK